MEKLLIVDDSGDIRKQLQWGLGKDYNVILAGERKEALSLSKKHHPKVVLLDLGLPPDENGTEEGFKCLEEMLGHHALTKVIVVTGQGERENALKAIQAGAYDFYQKPVDLNELKIIVKRAFHLSSLEEENYKLQTVLNIQTSEFGGIIGQCPSILRVFATVRKVATTDAPVLISGESGTGKEMVARAVHSLSLRKEGAFIPINCGAIPEHLLESELFGFEKGAFTGAHAQVLGKFEYAHQGTLFLDEIAELSLNLQVKLLRFLQDKIIQRVGGRDDLTVDARIIAATNTDILKAIEEGRFREDLYYRIGVISLSLPPLRERGDDIILLANFFLRRFSETIRKKMKGFSLSSMEFLRSYHWPGNVRELQNKIQSAVIMSESPTVELHDLSLTEKRIEDRGEDRDSTLKEARDRIEKDMLTKAFHKNKGNMTKIAEVLGISRPTLYDLMKKHGLQP